MKMKKVILTIIACWLCVTPACLAQNARELMDANQKVFELVDAYAENADLTDGYVQKIGTFRDLFKSQNATVYMDHINWYNNSNRKDTTMLSSYCAFYEQQQGTFRQFEIQDVHINRVSRSEDVWFYSAALTKKYMTYTDNTPVISHLVLHIEYSFALRTAKIVRIECTRADSRMKPHILANYLKSSNTLYIPNALKVKKIGGAMTRLDNRVQPLSAEVYKQLSNRNCATYQYVFTPHNDTLRYHTISVNTVKNAFGLEIGYTLPLEANRLIEPFNDNFDSTHLKSNTFHIGANYLRQIVAVGRHRLSLETGVTFEWQNRKFSTNNYNDQYNTSDISGDDYLRQIRLKGYYEKCSSVSLAIPVIVRYDYYVIPDLSIYAAVGARGTMVSNHPAIASFNGYYAGQYGEEYFNVLIDQDGYYDFGTSVCNNLRENNQKKTTDWHIDALARLGAQYFFTSDNRWSLDFSVGYRYRFYSKTTETPMPGAYHLSTQKEDFSSVCRNIWARPTQFLDFQLGVKYNL